MKTKLALALIAILATVTTLSAQPGSWTRLGESVVQPDSKSDVIRCLSNIPYAKLQVRVSNVPVAFRRIVVQYSSGVTEELSLRSVVEPGIDSRILDLPGSRRVIREITLYYDTDQQKNRHDDRPALVSVWGRR